VSPEERLEIIRELMALMPRDIKELFADGAATAALREALAPRLTPGFHITLEGPGFSERYEGLDGFIAGWQSWSAPWERYLVDIEGMEPLADRVLVDAIQTAVPQGASGEVVNEATSAWVFEGELVARVEFHLDREMARKVGAGPSFPEKGGG
jgi:hypothetical protein